ncbi:MAG: DUF424 family protein [Candidatus Diapherotrites archaeon]
MYAKIHSARGITVLACCDKKLLGKSLKDGKHAVTINRDFYGGKPTDAKELKRLLASAGSVNLFGEKAVAVALGEGLINGRDIIRIAGVPHVQIFRI